MQKLFRKASISLFNSGKIDKDTMHNYYMSGIKINEKNELINSIPDQIYDLIYSDRERSYKWHIKS